MIDWDRVAALRDEVGPEDFPEVVDLFLEEADEVVARLDGAPDAGECGDDLHFLKGSALSLGFAALGALCATGEAAVASGAAAEADIRGVVTCYLQSKTVFLAALGERFAA